MVIQKTIHIATNKQFQMFPITKQVEQVLLESGVKTGLVSLFIPHSSAGVRITDDEAALHQDILKTFYRLVPAEITHSHIGAHAQLKSALVGSSESIPVRNGNLVLGASQEIYFLEFEGGHQRQIEVTVMGE